MFFGETVFVYAFTKFFLKIRRLMQELPKTGRISYVHKHAITVAHLRKNRS